MHGEDRIGRHRNSESKRKERKNEEEAIDTMRTEDDAKNTHSRDTEPEMRWHANICEARELYHHKRLASMETEFPADRKQI